MSEQDKPNDGSLVPTGRRDLAPIAAANPLVSRGLADLTQGGMLKMKAALPYFKRGYAAKKKGDYDKAIKY